MIKSGQAFSFISLIALVAIIVYYIQKARRSSWVPNIRKLAGLDAIEEAIGRATEMGRPVHYTPGLGALQESTAAMTFAGLEILSVTARKIANYGAKLIVTIRQPAVLPLAEEAVRQAYLTEGVPDQYDPDSVRYLSSEQFAYAAGVMGLMQREQCAANIMLGAFWAESLIMAEVGRHIGAIQIAGTARLTQIPFFVAACDYVLIGEELFAASAVASGNSVKLGSIKGQDVSKTVALVLFFIGVLSVTFGSNWLIDLMGK